MALFQPIEKVVKDLCLRSGDRLEQNKGLYLNVAVDVWNDLNEDTLKIATRVKIPIRRSFNINKRTNSIEIPCDSLRLSSVNVVGKNGVFYPVYRNDKLHDDLVDIGGKSDCSCEFNCSYQLCNLIKGYEAVQSVKSDFMPNGDPVSFNCIDRKVVVGETLYSQTQYPMRIYLSGVWDDTVLHTEDSEMCNLEVDENGCICDTPSNIEAVSNTCCGGGSSVIPVGGTASCPPNVNDNTWVYYCNSKLDWFSVQCGSSCGVFKEGCNNIYNISELGNRLIFPPNFGFDSVMVRYFEDIKLADLQIPYFAKKCFMTGLQYYATENHDKKQGLANVYGKKFARQKWGLFIDLNKYRIEEQRNILTPPVYVPSYAPVRGYNSGGWQDFGIW